MVPSAEPNQPNEGQTMAVPLTENERQTLLPALGETGWRAVEGQSDV